MDLSPTVDGKILLLKESAKVRTMFALVLKSAESSTDILVFAYVFQVRRREFWRLLTSRSFHSNVD